MSGVDAAVAQRIPSVQIQFGRVGKDGALAEQVNEPGDGAGMSVVGAPGHASRPRHPAWIPASAGITIRMTISEVPVSRVSTRPARRNDVTVASCLGRQCMF